MEFFKDSRVQFVAVDKRIEKAVLDYTVFTQGGLMVDIRNQFHSSIQKNSDTWNYFIDKYNKN